MSDLDRWLRALADDATYTSQAASELIAALAARPSPITAARRRARWTSVACVAVACMAGATVGALIEAQITPRATAAILPASSMQTPTNLLFSEEG